MPALRLTPVGGEDKIFGRSGLLAHTYMLGPNGDSNGCVSFKDYYAFLNAYRNKGIRKLAVVAVLARVPSDAVHFARARAARISNSKFQTASGVCDRVLAALIARALRENCPSENRGRRGTAGCPMHPQPRV